MNMLPYKLGSIIFNGQSIQKKSTKEIFEHEIGYFIQGGRIFPNLTIKENLDFAGTCLSKKKYRERYKTISNYFTTMFENKNKIYNLKATYLSGGEKHQLSLAMVLMQRPKLLLLDEPSAGLSPANIHMMYKTLRNIKENENLSILLIEQNVQFAFKFSDRVSLLKAGCIENTLQSDGNVKTGEVEDFIFGNL